MNPRFESPLYVECNQQYDSSILLYTFLGSFWFTAQEKKITAVQKDTWKRQTMDKNLQFDKLSKNDEIFNKHNKYELFDEKSISKLTLERK